MCGRARCTLAPERVLARAGPGATWIAREAYSPTNNISPGGYLPVIRQGEPPSSPESGESAPAPLVVQSMRWGLVPSFTKPGEKPDFYRMFNARSETIQEKPSFRRLVGRRRCLVLVNGFYEWRKEGKESKKQPYYIYLEGEKPMALAGLWDTWRSGEDGDSGELTSTVTILTTDSCPGLQWLHDRMPAVLQEEAAQALWLDCNDASSAKKLHTVLQPYAGNDLRWRAVTKEMSNPRFQGPECAQELKRPTLLGFFQPKSRPGSAEEAAGPAAVGVKKKEEGWDEAEPSRAGEKVENAGPEVVEEGGKGAVGPSGDEKTSSKAEGTGGTAAAGKKVKEKEEEGVQTPGSAQKRKASDPLSTPQQNTPPSKKKKAGERPPDQPDISSFFTKNSKLWHRKI